MAEKPVAVVIGVMVLYMAMSVGTTFLNKFSFPKDKFPHPFSATCFQMIVAVVWLLLLTGLQGLALGAKNATAATAVIRAFGVSETTALRWSAKDILSSAGAAGAFTAMLSAGNMCLLFVQISFYQAAKSQHILCNLVMGYFIFGTTQPWKIIMCCVGVTVGFLINVLAERKVLEEMAQTQDFATELAKGCLAGLISSFFVALYPILLDRSFLKGSDTWQVRWSPSIAHKACVCSHGLGAKCTCSSRLFSSLLTYPLPRTLAEIHQCQLNVYRVVPPPCRLRNSARDARVASSSGSQLLVSAPSLPASLPPCLPAFLPSCLSASLPSCSLSLSLPALCLPPFIHTSFPPSLWISPPPSPLPLPDTHAHACAHSLTGCSIS